MKLLNLQVWPFTCRGGNDKEWPAPGESRTDVLSDRGSTPLTSTITKNPEAARLSGFFVVLQWIPLLLLSCIYPFYKDYCTPKRTVSGENYK